jgi:hypothetical protein
MQQQTRSAGQHVGRCIHGVSPDGVAQVLQVHPQLVGASAQGSQRQPSASDGVMWGLIGARAQALPQRLAALSPLCHDAQRSSRPIGGNGRVDQVPIVGWGQAARHTSQVLFVDQALCKCVRQQSLHLGGAGKQHQTRGGLVDPVHHPRRQARQGQSAAQAVLLVRPATRHRQHPRRFEYQGQMRVLPQHGHPIGQGGGRGQGKAP